MMNDIIKNIFKALIAGCIGLLSYLGINHLQDIKERKIYFIMPLFLITLSFTILFLLSGCSSTKQIDLNTIEEKRITLKPKNPDPLVLQETNFSILKDYSNNYLCIGLSDYDKLVNNFQQMKKYIKEQKDIIEYYNIVTENKKD